MRLTTVSTPSAPLRVARLSPRATLPSRAHAGDAGADLHAAEEITLAPGDTHTLRYEIEVLAL